MINILFIFILLSSISGEIFDNLDNYIIRLRGFFLIEGFDVIKHGEGIKQIPGNRYKYIFYNSYT